MQAPHSGKDEAERLYFVQRMVQAIDERELRHPKAKLIVLGDVNVRINWIELVHNLLDDDVPYDVGEKYLDVAVKFRLQLLLPFYLSTWSGNTLSFKARDKSELITYSSVNLCYHVCLL